eukprot:scaffold280962_cov33-Tisochrysis_lutea.AAC.1
MKRHEQSAKREAHYALPRMPQHKSMCLCVHQRSQRQAARAAVFECSSVRQSSALSAPVPALPSARHHTDSAAAAGEGNLCAPHETGK